MTVPAGTVIALVVIVVASSAFDSSSRAKMVADVDCPDGLHTVVVCVCRGNWHRCRCRRFWRGCDGDGEEFEVVMVVCVGRHRRGTYWCRRSRGR